MLLHWNAKWFKHLQTDKAYDITDGKKNYASISTNKHKHFFKTFQNVDILPTTLKQQCFTEPIPLTLLALKNKTKMTACFEPDFGISSSSFTNWSISERIQIVKLQSSIIVPLKKIRKVHLQMLKTEQCCEFCCILKPFTQYLSNVECQTLPATKYFSKCNQT